MPEHLFLTGPKHIGKSTLLRKLLEQYKGQAGGFFTVKAEGIFPDAVSVHLLRAGTGEGPGPENMLFLCGVPDPAVAGRFDRLGCAALAACGGAGVLVMDELGPHEGEAVRFRRAVLRALDGPVPILGVLQEADAPFLREIAAHPAVRVLPVTVENRDLLAPWAAAWISERGY